MKQARRTNNYIFSLPIPREMQDQTLVHQEKTIHKQENKSAIGAHHLSLTIHQDISPKIIFKRERYQIAQVGRNFQPLVFSQWESYIKMKRK
jgi:hypothetical protein